MDRSLKARFGRRCLPRIDCAARVEVSQVVHLAAVKQLVRRRIGDTLIEEGIVVGLCEIGQPFQVAAA